MSGQEYKIRIDYSKTAQARYIAHLDTIDIISKALRRLKLAYAVTQGCHVRPKISFGPPLPLGHASQCENFVISLLQPPDVDALRESLNREFPAGMTVKRIRFPYSELQKGNFGELVCYRLVFSSAETAEKSLKWLKSADTSFTVSHKGKEKQYNCVEALKKAELKNEDSQTFIEAEFFQGLANVPSVSKIVTALAAFLAEEREDLKFIERTALYELSKTGDLLIEP